MRQTSPLAVLAENKRKYNDLISKLEEAINNSEELDIASLEILEGELVALEKIVYKIKVTIKDIANKLFTLRALKKPEIKTKLSDKSSIEFNEVLLYQGKPARAIKSLEIRAKKGDHQAQYLIGKTYLQGVIGGYGDIKMKDTGLGLKWLQVAYKNGIIEAGYLIAVYEKSVLNIDRAVLLFENLAKKNHLKSMRELLLIYKNDPKHKSMEKLLDLKQKLSVIED